MRQSATSPSDRGRWGGDIEAAILARALKRSIMMVYPKKKVHRNDNDETLLQHFEVRADDEGIGEWRTHILANNDENAAIELLRADPEALIIYWNGDEKIGHFMAYDAK